MSAETAEDFIAFKMRQSQRKNTPQSQNHPSFTSSEALEWEEFDLDTNLSNVEKSKERFKSEPILNITQASNRIQKRSFDIGAERPVNIKLLMFHLIIFTEMISRLDSKQCWKIKIEFGNETKVGTSHRWSFGHRSIHNKQQIGFNG
jgi:hypothetical protein